MLDPERLSEFPWACLSGLAAGGLILGTLVLGFGWEGPSGVAAAAGGLLVTALVAGGLGVLLGALGRREGAVEWSAPYAVLTGLGGGLLLAGVDAQLAVFGTAFLLLGLAKGVKGQARERERERRPF